MSEVVNYTAGIPPLSTIKDADTRRVLEAIVTGWRTRNGDLRPNSDQRFITKGELSSLVTDINNGYFGEGGEGRTLITSGIDAGTFFDAVELLRALEQSPLWTELNERVELIDVNLVAEQQARIAAVQEVADDLAEEAETRLRFENVTGSKIAEIEQVNNTQATQISGLTTRISDSESTIVSLQQTTSTTATELTSLTTRVSTAENNITTLDQTTESQAQSLTSLTTRVGTAESNISTLQTTSANQATSLTALTAVVNSNTAAITNEATVRANADNAISDNVTTQVARVDSSIAAVQTRTNTLANTTASLSSQVTTIQASLNGLSSALSVEASARVNADNSLLAKYTVKIDNNGYLTGYGLMSTGNTATPTSDFIVRADRFSIVSPTGNRAVLIMTNNTINVFDESGNLRVKIGKLA